ncbi:hypothetical protein D0T92_06305 [Neisseria zalophi]|uniref:Uncharacterized protein n=1 Tax=Neisseria zalophi TaxID=640030 RepID=A0A5J6PUI4_9NEIS|nr:RHS repeat-associated core domain-containing protein [Neisseria zalophi]QEY26175.1 hypothetical protein D0T92_06305 [Neisseria zalophi]
MLLSTATDIERDKLHREIERTQGKLTSRYELDPLGRLKKQIAELNAVTQPKGKNKTATGHTAVKSSYGYDKTGNLIHSSDQRSSTTKFEYDKLGRITQADKETFAFDPAHNILSDGLKDNIADNRLKTYNGISYYYDDLGNLIHRELADGEVQNYFYDLHDQLVKVEIFKPEQEKETWVYSYDALSRRTGKGRLKNNDEVSDGLEDKTDFTWDGSHLIQEIRSDGLYTYIYTDKDAYEPLAQIRNWTNEEGESYQETNYFHCDQIGIPREMTDSEGKLLWFGDYYGWGKLKSETNITGTHQPFRLQNQYCDTETGLHYNFSRYYEPECGRFVNQNPIGLNGSINLYIFASNTQKWIDPLGWSCDVKKVKELANRLNPKLKQRFKCTEFADALQKEMKKEGISGERVKVKTHSNHGAYGNIWSDKAKANISENGIHHAIKCGDTVFDNMNPGGMEHNKWVSDLFSPGGYSFSSVSS